MVRCGITAENTARWVHLVKNVAPFFLFIYFFYSVGLMEMWILNVYGPEVALVNEWDSFWPEHNESLCAHCEQACWEPGTCEEENQDCQFECMMETK